jgi:hypothetical protein
VEVFGKFSPDGKWIAFTGQYDGDEQVYVVPTSGGEPRQLTFYPAKGPAAATLGAGTTRCLVGPKTASASFPITARFMDASDCAFVFGVDRWWSSYAVPDADCGFR